MGTLALHPEHLAYLRQRGILDDTISAAGLHSSRPQDLHRLAGRPIPDDTSGLVIPYPNADGYRRVRLFPPLTTADGREQKFGQPIGSPVRLYIPPGLSLDQPDAALFIIEGELKALALWQIGFPAVALGGVYNFRTHALPSDRLIPDLEAIPWEGRAVYLVPDSDAWEKDQVMLAVYRLARILEQRKAGVLIVKIPTVKGTNQGADDFLVGVAGHGKDPLAAWRKLVERAVTLRHPAFMPFREAEKAKARTGEAAALPAELVGRRLHRAIHFDEDGFATVGVFVPGPDSQPLLQIITSSRHRYAAGPLESALTGRAIGYADLIGRWHPDWLARYLIGHGEVPTFAVALSKIIHLIDGFLEMDHDSEIVVPAAWALATWFSRVFLTFPRLDVRGERGSGKTKLLSILSGTSLNGILRVCPTPAVLFRLAESLRATLCLDEIEGLGKEDRREILAIINQGYKVGGRVDRCEGDDQSLRSFDVYTPIALAGIQGLNRVTEDRAITLVLRRAKDRKRLNAEVNPSDQQFIELRDLCYRLALSRWQQVADTQAQLVFPDWLNGRERELWRPLLAIGTVAEQEEPSLGVVQDLLTFAREQGEERAGLSDEMEALLSVLQDKLGVADTIEVSPADLCEDLQRSLHWDKTPDPRTVGRWLKRVKIPKRKTKDGARYSVTWANIEDLHSRFGGGLLPQRNVKTSLSE
jgi:hypothetical protein